MPERKNVLRLDASAVQGEDAWVDVRRPTVGERLASLEADREAGRYAFEANAQEVVSYVVGWNWVGDDGTPLPQPAEDPEVYKQLTSDEIRLLLDGVWGAAEQRKN